jgi:integrase
MANSRERHGKGTIVWVVNAAGDGCWYARFSVKGESRQRKRLSTPEGRDLTNKAGDEALAREQAAELSKFYNDEARRRELSRHAARTTVEQFGELWTSGELLKTHGEVRKLKKKKSVEDDVYRLRAHVYPYIGRKPVADVTEQDIEQTVARAAAAAEAKRGKPWRQGTKFQLYQILKRLFDLAVKPGRLRSDNPVSIDLRPGRDSPKLYSFLYPEELLTLLGCTEVPLAHRVHYALGTYTGLRKSSLKPMTCGDLDFEHGTITSLDSKTGLPQIFAQSDPLLPGIQSLMVVLKRWLEHRGNPPASALLVVDLECREGREAETLREDLKTAGITRKLLFTRSERVEPLRFHDTRATFVTWARRAGKGQGWIADRTGHLTDEMMQRYDRGARQLADLQYEPFPDISKAIPELATDLANVTRLADFRRP